MSSKAITIRTETATIAQIDALADAMDRSRNYVVNQAMISYVARANMASGPRQDAAALETETKSLPAQPAPPRESLTPPPKNAAAGKKKKAEPKPKKKGKKKKKKSGKKSKK